MSKSAALTAAVLALTAFGGTAMAAAAQHETVGKIERLNEKSHRLTVNHHRYRYNPHQVSQALKQGQSVRVLYRMDNGHRIAERILPATS